MEAIRFLLLFLFVAFIFSCDKDDSPSIAPPRDYGVQYTADADTIEAYLENNYLVIDANNNATILPITDENTQTSIKLQQEYPLQYVMVRNDTRNTNLVDGLVNDATEYKLYYIILNEGGGQTPSVVDSVFVGYKGWTTKNVVFDENQEPTWGDNNNFVSGFRQILTKVKTAESFIDNPDGTVSFTNAGNVIVFIPSGLGYFNLGPNSIGSYQNLIFQIKLNSLLYRDHDRDGIRSKNEKYGTNTDIWKQDSDGDNVPDFLDIDDDGDTILTKVEIKDAEGNYYDFDAIPDCNGDTTSPDRIKKHVNPACQ